MVPAGVVRAPAAIGAPARCVPQLSLHVPSSSFAQAWGSVSVVTGRIRSEGGCGLGQLLLLLSVCVGAGAMVLTQLT